MNIKWFLFSFKGRINRQTFWAFTLSAGLLWLILNLLLGVDILHRHNRDVKSLIPTIILLWPCLAVQAKRWHDRDKSAWWLLIGIVPLVGSIWTLIENGCLPGTAGENRFGEDPLGRASKEPATDENISLLKAIPAAEWKPGKYYLSTFLKVIMILSCVMVLFSSVIALKISALTSIEIPGGIFPFAVIDTAIIAVIIWRMMTPVVDITETGIKVGIPFIFKTNTAKWDEIDAMVIGEINYFGIKERNIKLLLKSERGRSKEMLFSLKAVEKPEEIIERLRARIPEKGYEDIKQAPVLQKPMTKSEVRYRGWTLNETGLTKGKETIFWNNVIEIKYAALVIAGYGATTITYSGVGGRNKSVTVQPATKEDYLDFIRYLIHHSRAASIDPGFLKALEYSPKAAKADIVSVALFITGLVLFFISPAFIFYYSDGISRGYLNAALWFPVAVVPMVMSIKGLAERFRGNSETSSNKIIWAALFNLGQISAVLVFLAFAPTSLYWMAGDISVKTGNLEKAEQFYQLALDNSPENLDVLYELGKLNLETKTYEKAFDYLKRAYTKDPTYWGPRAVELVPDTLMKMGRYDEALKWCERILNDRPDKRDIARAINKKKDEIITAKKLIEKKQNKL